ncbi:MAG: hypothetical protein BWX62_00742 [Bacteroidetes bacterium ADurb.Bin037]|nr:MAG: hypothetical protein BWX62_00742 [Bacteroidetes bacterium ADurb.Bin037]
MGYKVWALIDLLIGYSGNSSSAGSCSFQSIPVNIRGLSA